MTILEVKQLIIDATSRLYDKRESANIASLLLEWITQKNKINQLLEKHRLLSDEQVLLAKKCTQQLSTGEPVQYIMGEAWFMGMPFKVTPQTLIPRPETEELVEWMLSDLNRTPPSPILVLEIGSGTGCIPISLKKKLPYLLIESVDISSGAIQIATQNASIQGVSVEFKEMDFLKEENWDRFIPINIIVSNPPYIKESESALMHPNVLEFEPSVALFVPDNDALIFYRKIKTFSNTHLLPNGRIYLEVNELLAKEVANLFEIDGCIVDIRTDMQGKQRMVRVIKTK